MMIKKNDIAKYIEIIWQDTTLHDYLQFTTENENMRRRNKRCI